MRAFAQADRFVSEVEARKLRPVYVFVGDEAFFRKRCRDAILHSLVPNDLREFSLYEFDLADTDLAEVLDRARTPSLMAPFQVFFVRGVKNLFGRGSNEDKLKAIEEYAKDPNPDAVLIFVAMILASCDRRLWGRRLILLWIAGIAVVGILMWGGIFGLSYVPNELWGGLPLTLILAVIGIAFAFPLAILLALGRRSRLPAVRTICVAYIELIRGVPLITVLFMASVMLPLFLPTGMTIDKLLRAQTAFIFFAAAYLAEVVRGGLQAIPRGQIEAADALGLSYWRRTWLIVLPQALALVIPPLVNTFIGTFKDTTLVIIIGLFDLLGAINASLNDANWRGTSTEAYVFAAAIYFCFCFFMSRYSQMLERELNKGRRR